MDVKEELSKLLINVVEEGASIGFLPPLSLGTSLNYWEEVEKQSNVILYIAKINDQIVGSIQLHLVMKENGLHRAEIAKLMTHTQYRRLGIGRLLMNHAEKRAVEEKRTLIVLDTRAGDPSNLLYTKLHYQRVGEIPKFAMSAEGQLHPTVLYYKELQS
ncbi:GNAT family N-acetyltransferase [Bacillus suaedaesalsae]|uniref:GNAT family N-acetyltransferase n=1 Tax=Bacillus suaedaesalsae TaxID=2810349 RepID=A0ABS2DG55_9BACI|nr:GNAT family N-acetyltransferase [Bacillus suaedaesalsae]MBM6617466.1 GNAT family N-acetyltransferase [Bacillus suaedaesalsae]